MGADTPAKLPKRQKTAAGKARRWWRCGLRWVLFSYIAAMLALLAVWFSFFEEPLRLTVEEVPVQMRGWAPGAAPVRVVLLADMHATALDGPRLGRIVACALEQQPEAVVLLGDYFSALKLGNAMPAEQVAAYLAPLAKQCKVYYVCGNHDVGAPGQQLRAAFKKAGFVPLENAEHVQTFSNGQKVKWRGLPYTPEPQTVGALSAYAKRQERRFTRDKLPQDMPLIVAAHSPYCFLYGNVHVDLAVAGHTHGGQVCAPGGEPLVATEPWTRQTERAGMHRGKSGSPVYVSRGLGLSRLPIRMFCPPEITVLVLQPSP